MSAIAGYWSLEGENGTRASCTRMLASQSIYGPHGEDIWADGQISLGKRLFQSLPEDRHSRTMVEREGSCALVADLRLDNRAALLERLGFAVADWSARSDSAILFLALLRWGDEAVDHIVGDFAFAWWDGVGRRLILARDFLGQRPLHYHVGREFAAFASMPKGLHALPEIPRAPRAEAIADFLALMPEGGSGTFFENVEKVEPGHVVCIRNGQASARRYWRPDVTPLRLRSPAEYEEALREQIDLAVSARLRGAQGKVGSHLSAGLDSSTVAATAARLLAPSGGRVVAFTAVPAEGHDGAAPGGGIGDEWPLAAATAAAHPNIDHVAVRPGRHPPSVLLDRHFFLADRPILNLVNFPWWDAINDAAKERRLSIMLTGIMGNMSFSHSGMELLSQLFAKGRILQLAHVARQLRGNGMRWGTMAAQAFGPFLPHRLWTAIGRFRGRAWDIGRYSAIRPDQLDRMGVRNRAAERGLDFSYRPMSDGVAMRLWVLRRADPGNYNKAMLGGWGIDARDPTADKRLVEFCLRVPAEEYLRGGMHRSLARRAFVDRLPQAVLTERRKGYQAADWHERLTGDRQDLADLVERLGDCAPAAELIDIERMRKLVEDWPAGNWHDHEIVQEYRLSLLRGVTAGHFVRKASGTN